MLFLISCSLSLGTMPQNLKIYGNHSFYARRSYSNSSAKTGQKYYFEEAKHIRFFSRQEMNHFHTLQDTLY